MVAKVKCPECGVIHDEDVDCSCYDTFNEAIDDNDYDDDDDDDSDYQHDDYDGDLDRREEDE